jgi:hypothetical protein
MKYAWMTVLAAVSVLALSSCGSQPPITEWLAHHGGEVPVEMARAVMEGQVAVGMPKSAVEAVVKQYGHRIIERKDLGDGLDRLTYRMAKYDTVGKTHTAQAIIIFRDGIVISVNLIPEN